MPIIKICTEDGREVAVIDPEKVGEWKKTINVIRDACGEVWEKEEKENDGPRTLAGNSDTD